MYKILKGQVAKKIRYNGDVSLFLTREDIKVLVEANNKNAEIIDDLLLVIDNLGFRIDVLESAKK